MTREVKLLVGIPGSGKSYWAKKEAQALEADGFHTAIISRDAIRFSMLKPGEDYFAHENEVFDEFIRQINEALEIGIDYVFVDATHISPPSRNKTLSRLRPDPRTNLCFEEFHTPVSICIRRNAGREGLAKVPNSAIKNMSAGFRTVSNKEISNYRNQFKKVLVAWHVPSEKE